MKMKIIDEQDDGTFCVEVERGWFRPRLELYIGQGTVWCSWKTKRRAGTLMESRLSDFVYFETRGVRT